MTPFPPPSRVAIVEHCVLTPSEHRELLYHKALNSVASRKLVLAE